MSWQTTRDLPRGRSQAGDRHLNFHDVRDNLLGGCAGAPHHKVLAAHAAGLYLGVWIDEEDRRAYAGGYCGARWSRATHAEALGAHVARIDLGGYAAARAAGATHEESLEAGADGDVEHGYRYMSARRVEGLAHREALAAARR